MQCADLPEVRRITTLSRSSIYRGIAAGEFPAPAKFAGRSVWDVSEIHQYIADRMAARPAKATLDAARATK